VVEEEGRVVGFVLAVKREVVETVARE